MENDEKPMKKRKKLVDSNSSEIENQSLILEKLAIGSGDALVKIFASLSSPKEKVRLERVCRRFKTLSSTPEAWSTMKQLNIETVHKFTIRINGDDINIKMASAAIQAIISRNRNFTFIALDLDKCSTEYIHRTLTLAIMRTGSIKFPMVEELCLNGQALVGMFHYIALLIAAFKDNLKYLSLSGMRFLDKHEAEEFWMTIGQCQSLVAFCYTLAKNEPVSEHQQMTTAVMVKKALNGKALRYLGVHSTLKIGTDDIIEIVSSLADPTKLTHLSFSEPSLSLVDFVQRLPPDYWSSLETFWYFTQSQLNEGTRSAILRLPQLCQRLNSVQIITKNSASSAIAAELIYDLLNVIREEEKSRQFNLILSVAPDAIGSLIGLLVVEYACEASPCQKNQTATDRDTNGRQTFIITNRGTSIKLTTKTMDD